jgi:tetratricopeptide (TPR) repeat protein
VVVTLVSVAICAVEARTVADTEARGSLGVDLLDRRERSLLAAADQVFVTVGMLFVPAALFLGAYLANETSRTEPSRLSRARWGAVKVLACGATAIAAGALLLTAHPPGPEDCRRALARLRELNPGSGRPDAALGVFEEGAGRFTDAATAYRSALDRDPGLTAARFGLGNVLYRQGAIEAAETEYREVLRREPSHVSARQNLGIALYDRGIYEEAARCFVEVLRLDPRHAAAQNDLGAALVKLGRRCEALPHLERGAALDRRFAGDTALQAEIARIRSACALQHGS